MCVVSMVGDHYHDKWQRTGLLDQLPLKVPEVSRSEFDELKREVREMKELLKRAKQYDEDNNEPDCEIESKMEVLRRVAEAVGVDLNDVIGSR